MLLLICEPGSIAPDYCRGCRQSKCERPVTKPQSLSLFSATCRHLRPSPATSRSHFRVTQIRYSSRVNEPDENRPGRRSDHRSADSARCRSVRQLPFSACCGPALLCELRGASRAASLSVRHDDGSGGAARRGAPVRAANPRVLGHDARRGHCDAAAGDGGRGADRPRQQQQPDTGCGGPGDHRRWRERQYWCRVRLGVDFGDANRTKASSTHKKVKVVTTFRRRRRRLRMLPRRRCSDRATTSPRRPSSRARSAPMARAARTGPLPAITSAEIDDAFVQSPASDAPAALRPPGSWRRSERGNLEYDRVDARRVRLVPLGLGRSRSHPSSRSAQRQSRGASMGPWRAGLRDGDSRPNPGRRARSARRGAPERRCRVERGRADPASRADLDCGPVRLLRSTALEWRRLLLAVRPAAASRGSQRRDRIALRPVSHADETR